MDTGIIGATIAALNMIATIGGGFYFLGRVTGRLDAYEKNTLRVEGDVHEMKALLIVSAVEADRLRRAEADIDNLETDVRNLRRGVGYINDEGARSINRQY